MTTSTQRRIMKEAERNPRKVARILANYPDEVIAYQVISIVREGLAVIGAEEALGQFNEELVLQKYCG